jgi:serine/threonine protein kinase
VLLARRVTHPNVCRIFDFGLHAPACGDPPLPFLTMELLTGATLAARLREQRPLAPAEMLDVAHQLAAGLHAAHGVEVIHKDLKSDNVMLIEDRGEALRAVITDFGLAATRALVEGAAVPSTVFSGTPGYVAPERMAGAPVTEATDVYSLGIVMTDMITGTFPGERSHWPAGVAEAVAAGAPLARLAQRCRAMDAGSRPALSEVLRALEEMQRRPRPGPGRNLGRRSAALGIVAVIVGIAFAGSRQRPRDLAAATLPAAVATTAAVVPVPQAAPATPAATAAPTTMAAAPRRQASPRVRRRKATPVNQGEPAAQTLRAAEERLSTGRVGEACALGQVAAGQAPGSPAAWEFLGRCYMRLPDSEEARACYRKYLELAPDGPRASLIRAIVDGDRRAIIGGDRQ